MSCDVIIGNGAGVAVAAEVPSSNGGTGHHDRSTVMLGLPKPHALCIIMRSGNSTIFGVPYATHLDDWIQTLPDKPLGKLGAYSKSFRRYLEDVLSANVSDIEVMRDFLWSWHDWLCKLRKDLERDDSLDAEGITQFFEQRAERFVNGERTTSEELSKTIYKHLGRGAKKNVVEKQPEQAHPEIQSSSIEGTIEEVFGAHLDDRARRAIQAWAYRWLGYWHPTPNACQITYVGYGRKDLFPGCDADKIEGFAFGKVYFRPRCVVSAASSGAGAGHFLFETIGRDEDVLRFVADIAGTRLAESGSQNPATGLASVPSDASFPLESERHRLVPLQTSIAQMSLGTLGLTAVRLSSLPPLAADLRGGFPSGSSRISAGYVTKSEGFRLAEVEAMRPAGDWAGL